MTTGSLLYLLMCLAMFGSFSAMLAWVSWQQPKPRLEMMTEGTTKVPETPRSLAA